MFLLFSTKIKIALVFKTTSKQKPSALYDVSEGVCRRPTIALNKRYFVEHRRSSEEDEI